MVSLVRILSCMAVAVLVVFSTPRVNADIMGFQGIYAPGNWTQSPPPGSITTSPTIVTLTSGNDFSGLPFDTTFSIMIPEDGDIKYTWSYVTFDDFFGIMDPSADPFLDSESLGMNLTMDGGPIAQGPFMRSVPVMAGQTFTFIQRTIDNSFGSATTTITEFSGPGTLAAVPEPATASLLGIAVLTGAFWQFFKRRRLATTA